jgi:hypothetical protein
MSSAGLETLKVKRGPANDQKRDDWHSHLGVKGLSDHAPSILSPLLATCRQATKKSTPASSFCKISATSTPPRKSTPCRLIQRPSVKRMVGSVVYCRGVVVLVDRAISTIQLLAVGVFDYSYLPSCSSLHQFPSSHPARSDKPR